MAFNCQHISILQVCVIRILYSFMSCNGFHAASDTGMLVNVALYKPTWQSSLYIGKRINGYSWRAVDGIHDQEYKYGSCTHTKHDSGNNYWVVDLMASYPIHNITITNRLSNYKRLTNFSVYISEYNPLQTLSKGNFPGELCLNNESIFPKGETHSLFCKNEILGRYVYVWKPVETDVLSICEFEVFVEDKSVSFQHSFKIMKDSRTYIEDLISVNLGINATCLQCVTRCLAMSNRFVHFMNLNIINGLCKCFRLSDTKLITCKDPEWLLIVMNTGFI